MRDEIGTCCHIEVEIDVTDKSLFFIRPYHIKEEDKKILDKDKEDKKILDKEIKRLCYLGI